MDRNILQYPVCSIRRGSFGGLGKWAEHLDITVLGTFISYAHRIEHTSYFLRGLGNGPIDHINKNNFNTLRASEADLRF